MPYSHGTAPAVPVLFVVAADDAHLGLHLGDTIIVDARTCEARLVRRLANTGALLGLLEAGALIPASHQLDAARDALAGVASLPPARPAEPRHEAVVLPLRRA